MKQRNIKTISRSTHETKKQKLNLKFAFLGEMTKSHESTTQTSVRVTHHEIDGGEGGNCTCTQSSLIKRLCEKIIAGLITQGIIAIIGYLLSCFLFASVISLVGTIAC